MIYVVISFLLASIILYVLLGGADFGAGIIELFSGSKSRENIIKVVNKAIAPIWEANHMWLIIAVVILFNAFPAIYAAISIYLYIPLIILLLGIIFRGTAFTFRRYDAFKDSSQKIYTILFTYSSFLVSFVFGLMIGALISNKLTVNPTSFYEGFIYPWLNLFSICVGLFVAAIFTFTASVYLIGDAETVEDKKLFILKSKIMSIVLMLTGGLVFISSFMDDNDFALIFFSNWKSLILIFFATLAIPFTWKVIAMGYIWLTRIFAGIQVVLILGAFYIAFFPIIVRFKNAEALTLFNSAAPQSTLSYLGYALIVGSFIIFPLLAYLIKVFKGENR